MKQVRLSEFTISEIRRIGSDISSSMDDVTVRHLIASYDLCKARSVVNIPMTSTEKHEQEEIKKFELVRAHELKAVEIVAQAKYKPYYETERYSSFCRTY